MKHNKKLRVFEAFAGIGAQAAALKNINIDYEIVGISDWFIDAIECYATIHCEDKTIDVPKTKAEVLEYLSKFTFSADSVHPYNITRLSEDRLRDLYRANKKSNNYGSISDIKAEELPDFDLLVYSFPCQDLSTGGLGKGMKKGVRLMIASVISIVMMLFCILSYPALKQRARLWLVGMKCLQVK